MLSRSKVFKLSAPTVQSSRTNACKRARERAASAALSHALCSSLALMGERIVDDRLPLSLSTLYFSLISFDLSFANANWKQIVREFLVVQLIVSLHMLHIFVCMCVVRTYVKSAGNVGFVGLLCYLLRLLHCSLQLPATATDATPTQRYPPLSLLTLRCRSLSLLLVYLWTVYNAQCCFCFLLWVELQSVLVSLQSVRTVVYPVKFFIMVFIHFQHLKHIFLSHTSLNFLPSQLEIHKYHITLNFLLFHLSPLHAPFFVPSNGISYDQFVSMFHSCSAFVLQFVKLKWNSKSGKLFQLRQEFVIRVTENIQKI